MKPLRYASWLAMTYLLLAGGYILVSGRIAATIAHDVAELERIEHIKGFAFVIVTGLLLFGASWVLFAKFAQAEETRSLDRRALALIHSKAYAAELAAAVAHDFNNLLLVLRAGVDEWDAEGRQLADPTVLQEMRQALDSARGLTERMARAARGTRSARQETHCLATLVDDTVRLLRRLPRLRGRYIEVELSSHAQASLDPVLVEQILVNLLLNAADAVGEGGKILVEVKEDAAVVCLDVQDSGEGLTDEKLRHAFEPFTTTKEAGLGLGLLSVRTSVEASQGTLTVARGPLGGAMFEVRWPKTSASR